MRINFSQLTSPTYEQVEQPTPLPGEIWEVNHPVRSPLEFSDEEKQKLYSNLAKKFLNSNCPPRYVMIVKEPEPALEKEQESQIVSVMLLSEQTSFLSDVDILIPSQVSGIGQNVLAETWHILPTLTCNLSRSVGQRLSRDIYDVLLTIGDYYYGLVNEAPSIQEIQSLGLQVRSVSAEQKSEIEDFHQQEEAWTDVLKIPLDAYYTYQKTIKFTSTLLEAAAKVEQEFTALNKKSVNLSQCLQNIFEKEWQIIEDFWVRQTPNLAFAAVVTPRSRSNQEEILSLIDQMSAGRDESQRCRAAKRLGKIASGNADAIQALINLLHTTEDDETLWASVESLWQIDPGNPATGARMVKLIDLGMQVDGQAVALAVALVQKANQQVGILLRVYPTYNEAYLPPDLKLILLDESGQILREVAARRADDYIQLKLSGYPGEQFSVRVALKDAGIIEDFII